MSFSQFLNDPERRFAPVHPLHIIECIADTGFVALKGRASHMGGQGDVVELQQWIVR